MINNDFPQFCLKWFKWLSPRVDDFLREMFFREFKADFEISKWPRILMSTIKKTK